MTPALFPSYAYCRALARRAGNFYFAFWSLPADQYWAMCALYGFMRQVDDAGDDPQASLEQRGQALARWRDDLTTALHGDPSRHLVFPALMETVRTYQIPHAYLYELIDGVESDLRPVAFQTDHELSDYCYHVAGVIGLCCIHVWGFHDERIKPAAIACGEAFQLTNILRDLAEDQALGRCYLPEDALRRAGYTSADLAQHVRDDRFRQLMAEQVGRARELYRQGNEVETYLSPLGRPIFGTMVKLYRGLLDEIERRDYDVFTRRVRLSKWTKLRFAASGFLQRLLVSQRPHTLRTKVYHSQNDQADAPS